MALEGKGSITNNGLFVYPRDADLTKADLKSMLDYHSTELVAKYSKARKYYTGQHPILEEQRTTDLDKPNNRLVVNYPRYIVDTFNGFFLGIEPKITLDDETDNKQLQQFNSGDSVFDKLAEVSKQVSVYGRSYLFAYQNEASETHLAVVSPESGFIVYDNSVAHDPLAFVRYEIDDDNNMTGTVYQNDGAFDLDMAPMTAGTAGMPVVNPFKAVPAIEFFETNERQGTFENVETLIDSVNKALSQKANDVDYFADAYMKILGAKLDDDTLKNIKNNHIINFEGLNTDKIIVDFMEKPNADGEQENLINRLNNLIFQISMVANITDETFGNASSGVSLQYKLLAMRNLASGKERKFTQSLRQLYKLIFGVDTILKSTKGDEWQQLKFQFTRNLPSNLVDEAATAKSLEGVVSRETQLKMLSVVDDPDAEIKRIDAESAKTMKQAVRSAGEYDFQKKSGDDVNGEE